MSCFKAAGDRVAKGIAASAQSPFVASQRPRRMVNEAASRVCLCFNNPTRRSKRSLKQQRVSQPHDQRRSPDDGDVLAERQCKHRRQANGRPRGRVVAFAPFCVVVVMQVMVMQVMVMMSWWW